MKAEKMFRVGDKVTTDFNGEHYGVVRTVTHICKDSKYGSSYAVCVDGGEPCSKCGKNPTKEIDWIDSA